MKSNIWLGMATCGALLLSGCRQDMHNQPKYKPFAATDFFGDGRSARPVIEDTVARGHLRLDAARFTGKMNGNPVDSFPFKITLADVRRGQERFHIFCSPCHGRLGNGQGMIPRRGFRQPPSYHIDRLRKAPVGHFFDVATNGFGAMPSYASRVPVDDRWRIIAYIRALQYSESATVADVPADQRDELARMPETPVQTGVQPTSEEPQGQPTRSPSAASPVPRTEKATEK